MFVTKAQGQMKDREVGDKGSLATQLCMPGQENWAMAWSVCQKTVSHVGGPFVFHFVHSPQILSFPSAQTHRVISSPTHWSILPVHLSLPWAKPQLHFPKRLFPETVFGFSVALSQRQEVGS